MKDTQLYVKKLVSLHPDEWEFIPLDKAMKRYGEYKDYGGKKSLKQWLETEI